MCMFTQLYEAFNVGEYQLEKSNQLAKELETLRYELEPLEEVSNSCPLLYSPLSIHNLFIRKKWN